MERKGDVIKNDEVDSQFPMLTDIELNQIGEKNEDNFKDFDEILEVVGGKGKYQKFILYIIIGSFMILMPIFALNKIFLLSIPNHNCHVDGKPPDMDIETWKNMTLPKEIGPDGNERFSQCQMFQNGSIVTCHKWDYDQTDYDGTIPSDHDWVCEKSHYATNVFTLAFSGNVFGSVIFGRAADRWGRKPILYFTLSMYILLQTLCLFIPQYFIPFLALHFISESAFPFLFMTPIMLAAEISGKDYRGWIYAVSWMIWVAGHCSLALISWLLRSWFLIGLCTTLPGALLLLFYRALPESPRWLIGIGRLEEAEEIIKDIARTNKRSIGDKKLHQSLLKILAIEQEDQKINKTSSIVSGTWAIFSKKRLARNTLMLCIASSMNRLLFDGLTLNSTSMSGNEFLNFLILGFIELPAGWLAGVMVDNAGRRWTQAGFFFLSFVACGVASITVFDKNLSWVVLVAAVTAKFGVGITTLVVCLQGTELFPTQLRSTVNGVSNFVSSVIGIGGPYIVFLGQLNAAGPYILLGLLSLLGAISSSYLPETLNINLPESVEEANQLGKNQKFWSFLPHKKEESEVKNKKSFNRTK